MATNQNEDLKKPLDLDEAMNNYNPDKIEQELRSIKFANCFNYLLTRDNGESLKQLKKYNEEKLKQQNDVGQMQLVKNTRGQRSSVEQDDALDPLAMEFDQFERRIQILKPKVQDKITLLESQLANKVKRQNDVGQIQLVKDTRGQRSSVEQDDDLDQLLTELDQLERLIQILKPKIHDRITLLESELAKFTLLESELAKFTLLESELAKFTLLESELAKFTLLESELAKFTLLESQLAKSIGKIKSILK